MLSIPPLYPITDPRIDLSLSRQVSRFADAGFPLVQFRGKGVAAKEHWQELRTSLSLAEENGGWPQIIVNDRADFAILATREGLEPWGLHLGQRDIPVADAIRMPGLMQFHFGASTHNPKEWSLVDSSCDHAGVGPFRATTTKPDHEATIGTKGLEAGCLALRQQNIAPIAIGGLAIEDALTCFLAGAESLAMAHELSPQATGNDDTRLADYLWQAQKIKFSIQPIINRKAGVAIVGGSGAGKTALSNSLAPRLGFKAKDLDAIVSEKAGKTIAEIFNDSETMFRKLESECLPECLEYPSVVALGAGAWHQETIRDRLQKSGWTILWLAEVPSTAWERARKDVNRPLAKDRATFMQRWRSRMKKWSVLPSLLPLGRSPDELAELLAP
ncbi:MAG: thiamine phosphate synthase [Holophagaceae bacterium]|nr:thiamine phosphate synthase [Holophagaceae bacterium]